MPIKHTPEKRCVGACTRRGIVEPARNRYRADIGNFNGPRRSNVMQRYRIIDRVPRPIEVTLPQRSDGVGYALRRAFPAASNNNGRFTDLLCALDSMRFNGRFD